MDEREKIRKFRELDDAFAQALRDLDGGPRTSQSVEPEPQDVGPAFEERLHGLMTEYALSQGCVHEMLSTLVQYKKMA
ncbi:MULTISPECIES: hypothetical protein [Salinicola]|uniref:Uncharacterized protein n=1 Tax=Salinicola socius TaxID=404433 RepID=A0A1Q8SPT0_9GAMM|nr:MULTISPECIES: hypothetical protein [Salinicola]OLO03438.1 hypothetical protein BTW07_15015 [Salinicola socius]